MGLQKPGKSEEGCFSHIFVLPYKFFWATITSYQLHFWLQRARGIAETDQVLALMWPQNSPGEMLEQPKSLDRQRTRTPRKEQKRKRWKNVIQLINTQTETPENGLKKELVLIWFSQSKGTKLLLHKKANK